MIPKQLWDEMEELDDMPPLFVKCVTRLKYDVEVLMFLTCCSDPPENPVCARHQKSFYMVGNASGRSFGCCSWLQGSEVIDVDFGTWTLWITKDTLSNYKEATNLVLYLKRSIRSGKVKLGSELFLFRDNKVAECTYFCCSSKSSRLHTMILELQKMELDGELIIHFIWISGKRMIAQSTDGVSQADLSSGVMRGQDFLKYLPLDETAIKRQKGLLEELLSWPGKKGWKWQQQKTGLMWYSGPQKRDGSGALHPLWPN